MVLLKKIAFSMYIFHEFILPLRCKSYNQIHLKYESYY